MERSKAQNKNGEQKLKLATYLLMILVVCASAGYLLPEQNSWGKEWFGSGLGLTGAAVVEEGEVLSVGTMEIQTEETPFLGVAENANSSSCGFVNESLTLTGNVNSSGTCFTINASNVVLDCNGYTIRYATGGSGYGVNVSANSSTIRNCTIIENNESGYSKQGIGIEEVRDVLIENNNFYILINSNAISSSVLTPNNITIKNNYMNTSSRAIYFLGSNSLINQNNIISNCYQCGGGGVVVGDGTSNTISNNTINMTNDYGPAISLSNANNGIINNNSVYTIGIESSGIYLSASANATLTNNHIDVVKSVGIRFSNSDSSVLDYLHNIDQTNTVNGLPVLYNYSLSPQTIVNQDYSPYGQVICSNCSSVVYNNVSVTNRDLSIYKSDNLTITNSSFITDIGLHLLIINSVGGRILNNNFDQNGSDSGNVPKGIEFSYSPNATFSNNNVSADKKSTLLDIGYDNNGFLMDNNRINSSGPSSIMVNAYSPFNATNNVLYSNSSSNTGFDIESGDNSEIRNNNITIAGTACFGILFYGSNLQIINNSISCNSGTTLMLYSPGNNNHFQGNFILGGGGIGISGANQEFVNDIVSDQTSLTIYPDGSATLKNVTLNTSKISVTGGNLTVSWYLRVNVTNSTGPLQNANVTIYNISNALINTSLTAITGFIETLTLTEFWQNATAKYYQTPHTINSSFTNYSTNTSVINLTQTNNTQINILLTPLSTDAYPYWYGNISSTPTTYSSSIYSYFNLSWNDDNNISLVYLESNYSGNPQNYTMNRISGNTTNGTYNYSAILPAGTFYWKSLANDSVNQWNQTDQFNFTIAQISSAVNLTLNGSKANITAYNGTTINVNCTKTTGEGNIYLLRNGTLINSGTTAIGNLTVLTLGNYNFTCQYNSTQNYSASSEAYGVDISLYDNPPNISQISPAANYVNDSSNSINLTFICNATDERNLQNLSLYLTNSSNQNFQLNRTSNLNGTSNGTNWTIELSFDLAQSTGNYTWNCLAYDNSSQAGWGTNRSILLNYTLNSLAFNLNLSGNRSFQLTGREAHNLTLNNATNTTAEITFRSTPTNYSLIVNNSQLIDTNSDSYYDHNLTLTEAHENVNATFTVSATNTYYSASSSSSSSSSGGGSSGGGRSTSTPISTPTPALPESKIPVKPAGPTETPSPAVPEIVSEETGSTEVKERANLFGGAIFTGSEAKSLLTYLSPYWLALISTLLIITVISGGTGYRRSGRKMKHLIISTSQPKSSPPPKFIFKPKIRPVPKQYIHQQMYYKQNVCEQMYQKELSQLNQKISLSKETSLSSVIPGPKPTPASAWDAQLQAIDTQISQIDQYQSKVRVISDLPSTRGQAKETIETSPEYHLKKTRKISALLALGLKKPQQFLTASLHHKEKNEEEKKAEQEYKRLLELHWKVDHYQELSTLEKLQLEEELDQIEKEIKFKSSKFKIGISQN